MDDDRTFGERVSDCVAKFGGSWKFIFLAVICSGLWMTLNVLRIFVWDSYPFILLNLTLSFIAAFQAPFILMSQRRCEVKQDAAYRRLFQEIKELVETDLRTENELKSLIEHQGKELKRIKKILERELD